MALQIRNLKLNDSRNQTLNILNSSTEGITTCKYKIKLDTSENNGNYYIVDNNGNKISNNDLKFINFTINIENIPLLKYILLYSTTALSFLNINDNSSNIQLMNVNVSTLDNTLKSNYYFNFKDVSDDNIIINNNNIIITILC